MCVPRPVGTRGGAGWMRGPGACPRWGVTILPHGTPTKRRATRTSTRPPPCPTSAPCPYRTQAGGLTEPRPLVMPPGQAPGPLIHSTPPLVPTGPWAASTSMDMIPRFGRQKSSEFDGLFLAYLCTTQPWWWSYTYPCIRQYFPYLEVLYRSSEDKKTVRHYRSKSMWYTNLCKLHWTVSKICVTLVLGPKFYVNYVSFSAYLREQPTPFH
jgi:hypothetical protein